MDSPKSGVSGDGNPETKGRADGPITSQPEEWLKRRKGKEGRVPKREMSGPESPKSGCGRAGVSASRETTSQPDEQAEKEIKEGAGSPNAGGSREQIPGTEKRVRNPTTRSLRQNHLTGKRAEGQESPKEKGELFLQQGADSGTASRQEMRSEGRTLQIGAEGLGRTLMEGKAEMPKHQPAKEAEQNLI